jgi:hypothetical protein
MLSWWSMISWPASRGIVGDRESDSSRPRLRPTWFDPRCPAGQQGSSDPRGGSTLWSSFSLTEQRSSNRGAPIRTPCRHTWVVWIITVASKRCWWSRYSWRSRRRAVSKPANTKEKKEQFKPANTKEKVSEEVELFGGRASCSVLDSSKPASQHSLISRQRSIYTEFKWLLYSYRRIATFIPPKSI